MYLQSFIGPSDSTTHNDTAPRACDSKGHDLYEFITRTLWFDALMHEWCLPRVHITCILRIQVHSISRIRHPSCLRHGTGRRLDVSRFLVLCVAVRCSLERTLDASRLLRTRTLSTLFLQDIQESYKIIQDIQICCARYTDMPFEATFD